MVTDSDILRIGQVLSNPERPLKERFRALFTLRNLGGELSISQISACFGDESVLLKHELAYCLGQMGNKKAIPVLVRVLEDSNQETMVRHEAAEALGAIGCPSVEEVLKKYVTDPAVEVAETCQLALGRIEWLKSKGGKVTADSIFLSVDPAPPSTESNIEKLKETLLDESLPLSDRYKAMFALRNLNTPDSAKALTAGFQCSSALFKHEIAYVLGQMTYDNVIPELISVVQDSNEHEMVRHEAAEAMGSIASEESINCLKNFVKDHSRVVAESCIVALDICDYEHSSEFQYANALSSLH